MSASNAFTALFRPLQVGALKLQNRIGMSALTRNRAFPTNVPNDTMIEYYRQRATGGAGIIVTEAILVSQQGTEWPNAPGIWSQDQVAAWKKVTDVVHDNGSYVYAQLWHVGRVAHPDMPEQKAAGVPVYAPSAIAAKGGKFRQLPGEPGYVTPTEIDDPTKLIELYKKAALNAKDAGFDGVEVHGANGYLIHQFLDSTSNKRADKWGGSVENRSRFALETLKAVIDVFGADRVSLKLSPAGGYNDTGMPLEETKETFSYLLSEIDKLGLSYVVLVRHSPMMDQANRGTPHDVVEAYGKFVNREKTKLFANSGYTPEEAQKVVGEDNTVDGVFFGFAWITHPDVAKRIQYAKPLDNTPNFFGLYNHNGTVEGLAKGYTDYPAADFSDKLAA